MKELILDGAAWTNNDDVYDALFRAVGAPKWHGRNFNALNDSIATGSVNKVEVPYRLVIEGYAFMGIGAKKMVDDLVDLIHEIAARGCPVEIRIDKSCVAAPELTCPFKVGERVKFAPDAHAYGWSSASFDRLRLQPRDIGTVTRIDENQYLYLDDHRGGFHWQCFERADS